jgi:hypothetical protein
VSNQTQRKELAHIIDEILSRQSQIGDLERQRLDIEHKRHLIESQIYALQIRAQMLITEMTGEPA